MNNKNNKNRHPLFYCSFLTFYIHFEYWDNFDYSLQKCVFYDNFIKKIFLDKTKLYIYIYSTFKKEIQLLSY